MTYDNNGNLQTITDSNGTTTYTWNARNRLVGVNGPEVNASFVYDGLGRREKKTINGNLTEFLFDGLNPVQETYGATVLANILPGIGIDEFLTRTDVSTGVTSSFLSNALGSSVALTDSYGAIQTEYAYEPFGKTSITGASNGSPYQYTSRENDGTGLYYYRARYYHPGLQRFINEDPIRFSGGDLNLYAYVSNKPLELTDPLGLKFTRPPFVPKPTREGEFLRQGGEALDEFQNRQERESVFDNNSGLIDEINGKLNDEGRNYECDTWVFVCGRLRSGGGTIKVYSLRSWVPTPPGVICEYMLAPGRRRDCCSER